MRNGDAVEQDALLVQLDETRAYASLAILKAKLDEALANEARLIAERDEAETIGFPAELLERQDEPQLRDSLRGQQSLFAARRETLKGEIRIYEERIGQVGEQIRGLRAQQEAKERQIALIGEELEGLRKLLEKGFA
ncbi:MAG TPA: HlyD family type I secretion periplasmic adaptor subunit, partial [Kiloniellaceae bacterium]|nr:HlyD family type I secretion periplasmic adaptor subunit [Kiloniellaceae bacterium]